MDLITKIEDHLKTALLSINATIQPSGYQYYNDVKVVNIHDEAVTIDSGGYPAILVELDPDEIPLSGEANAYRNKLTYKLTCHVINDDIKLSPKFAINKEMNELLSDIKYLFSNNNHLNDSCDTVSIIRSTRRYNTNNDIIRNGDLIIYISIIYSQSRHNPNLYVCV